jgi:hypothetical protein
MSSHQLLVKLHSDKAVVPKRGSPFAAGYDISSSEDTVIPARYMHLVLAALLCHISFFFSLLYFFFPPLKKSIRIRCTRRGRGVVKTDISIAVPAGTYGRVPIYQYFYEIDNENLLSSSLNMFPSLQFKIKDCTSVGPEREERD